MLELKNISVVFNQGTVNEKIALSHVNLELEKGDFVTIIGSNGAGKSTLFQTISGAVEATEGQVILNGQDLSHMPEYKRSRFIGRLFQDPLKGTAPSMTIEENLSLASQRGQHFRLTLFSHKHKQEMKQALAELNLGLEERLDMKVGTLSGGQRQALTLLMATYVKPELLLLDEHTAALDPKTAAKVLHITEQIIEQDQLTALMITHNMKDALRMGNRLVMMHDGKIIFDVEGEEKKKLTVSDLLEKFQIASGDELANDRMLLG